VPEHKRECRASDGAVGCPSTTAGVVQCILGHSQCKTLSQSLRQLTTYYLWYFADVVAYLLKKEVKK